MISFYKRLTGKNENGVTPPGLQAMSQNLQKKFAKGVQYNMKIIIKGDRNTGKTCLFHRLQGKKFVQEYMPTDEIQVTSIQWNYKTTDDIVKVEVWDVVDKGKKRAPLEGLKLGDTEIAPALDAEFLDVYKGTHGVILVMDITKNWTFEYVQKELKKIPEHIPVLVLGNHCDMSHHRTVTKDVATFFIDSVQRPGDGGQIRYTEASMSNGFGLKYVHKFFCLPFLRLQKEALLAQIERNVQETFITLQELDLFQQGPDSDYDKFLDQLSKRRRQQADLSSNALSSVGPLPVGQGHQIVPPSSKGSTPVVSPLTPVISSKIFGSDSVDATSPGGVGSESLITALDTVTSVEEFVPDGGQLDKSFLEDTQTVNSLNSQPSANSPDSDSDAEGDGGNPLVAGFQDDLDPDDLRLVTSSLARTGLSQSPVKTQVAPKESSPVKQNSIPSHQVFKPVHPAEPSPTGSNSSINIEVNVESTDWGVGLSERQSPEGVEDSPEIDSRSSDRPKNEKNTKSKKHKKKFVKDKDEPLNSVKDEKKKRKKSSKRNSVHSEHNELEDFLNSHDPSYEAI